MNSKGGGSAAQIGKLCKGISENHWIGTRLRPAIKETTFELEWWTNAEALSKLPQKSDKHLNT